MTAAVFAPFGDAVTVWSHPTGDALAKALSVETGAAVIRPDAYLGPVTRGGTRDAAANVRTWLESDLRLVATPSRADIA